MNGITIFSVIVAVLAVWLILTYNGLIRLRNRAKEAWADIEVQLKRRYDLIPNLVESVKGYARHESGAFESVTKARSAAMGAGSIHDKSVAENMLTSALRSLFAVAEAYPDLKANQNFLALQNELSDTENKIQAARRFYNTMVRDLNTGVEVFPTNLLARAFGFRQMEFFDIDDKGPESEPVAVKF